MLAHGQSVVWVGKACMHPCLQGCAAAACCMHTCMWLAGHCAFVVAAACTRCAVEVGGLASAYSDVSLLGGVGCCVRATCGRDAWDILALFCSGVVQSSAGLSMALWWHMS